jgi:hypothetical protein
MATKRPNEYFFVGATLREPATRPAGTEINGGLYGFFVFVQ